MEINVKDTQEWFKCYKKMEKAGKTFEFLMETLNCDIPDRFFDKIDLGSLICDEIVVLQKEKQFDELLELYNRSEKYKEKYEKGFYLDHFCIDYYFFKGEVEGIKRHLAAFLKEPVDSLDLFLPMYDKIVYYGYRDLSIQVCLDMIDKVKDAPGLIPGSESEFIKTIYADKMQSIYCDMKNHVPIDKRGVAAYFKKYDCNIEEADIDIMRDLWMTEQPVFPDFQEYMKNPPLFEWKLMLLFMDYMAGKNVTFATAYDIWDITSQCFQTRILSRKKAESFDSMFILDEEKYDREIYGRLDPVFSNKVTCAYAAAWGMQYVYDFLYKHDYISEETHDIAWNIIDSNKLHIIKLNADKMWQYYFLYKWEKPVSITEEQFDSIRELCEDSFSTQIVIIDNETFDEYPVDTHE